MNAPRIRPAADRSLTAYDVSVGHLARQLLRNAVAHKLTTSDPDVAPDPRLIAVLENLLGADIAAARDWPDLHMRLRRHGYELRLTSGVLALYTKRGETFVCAADALGLGCVTLVNRFGARRVEDPARAQLSLPLDHVAKA